MGDASLSSREVTPVALRRDFPDGVRLDLDLGVANYPVFLLDRPAKILASFLAAQSNLSFDKPPRVVFLCDENTAEEFGIMVESQFITSGWQVDALTVPAGEGAKSLATVEQVAQALSALQATRDTLLCSVGGGVVSDLAGFVAGVWQRGMHLVHISTTLVGLVDAAIGGKAAVNLPAGKNLIGLYKHPLAVAGDPSWLRSLSDDQYASGLAEAAKSALLSGEEFLSWIEEHAAALRDRDEAVLCELIARCMTFKAGVVAADPYEQAQPSARMALNYGHTLGHVIEALTSLDAGSGADSDTDSSADSDSSGTGPIPHGIAVAQGMRFAARLAMQLTGASRDFVLRQDALLDALGLPALDPGFVGDDLFALRDIFYSDKKTRDGCLRFVLLSAPGEADVVVVPDEILFDHLRAWVGMELEVGRRSGKYAKPATADEVEDECGEEDEDLANEDSDS